jgi:type II secretory pathway pseudopilin PulG
VAVLAILAILATAIFSATTKGLDAGYGRAESNNLKSFALALEHAILRNRYIPGTNDWYLVIASEIGASTNSVLYSPRNPTVARAFLVDPNLVLGHPGAALPYTNGPGSIAPSGNCRVMIISSLGSQYPAGVTSPANFNNLWATSDSSLPSEDLRIQRINLAPLFVKLTLANTQTAGNPGQYKVDTNWPPENVPKPLGTNTYFLKSTVLDLLSEQALGSTTNARVVLLHDSTFFYADSAWRDVPYAPSVPQTNFSAAGMAQKISASAEALAVSPFNTNSTFTPPAVANSISNFMYFYTSYAASASVSGNWSSGPDYNNASSAQTSLYAALDGLITPEPEQYGCTNGP